MRLKSWRAIHPPHNALDRVQWHIVMTPQTWLALPRPLARPPLLPLMHHRVASFEVGEQHAPAVR